MLTSVAALVLRLLVGGIFLHAGCYKVFNDASVPRGRLALTTLIAKHGFPAPAVLAILVSLAELVGGFLVLPGLLMRLDLIPLIVIVGLATFAFKWKAGFAGGWDWPMACFGMSVALFLLGPGRYSLDALLGLPLLE